MRTCAKGHPDPKRRCGLDDRFAPCLCQDGTESTNRRQFRNERNVRYYEGGCRDLIAHRYSRHGLVRSTSLEAAKEFLSGQVESMSIWPFCKRLRSVGRGRFAQCVLEASSYLELVDVLGYSMGGGRVPIRRSTSGNGSPPGAGFYRLLAGRILSGNAAAAGGSRRRHAGADEGN